ncbi:DUF4339 domain-containing protein [Luteolibacter yonseiensis]|uniref:DUF4339 domain-containing protein n=1 Tax=Luteolibacter yonseiensis TaxID=1144680 RepID=A0A934R8C1_9BACT|nr:GYF domain-containing protein [Luteolibacter yonseiensis]MBK1818177.1 DUF4339 domain-containing protein [Luteolibacter yonseiensis]
MQWYHAENGQRHGPISEQDLGSLIAAGRIGPATLIWREGMAQWLPLGQVSAEGGLAVLPPSAGYDLLRPATTSGLAIASMVCGILGLVLSCMFLGILGIPAVVCGHMAMHQINNSRNMIVGRGMALTGLICGYLGLLTMLGFILQIVFALAHFP